MSWTFVVVGGDAAGMSAASKAKRDDPEMEVIVFEKGSWVAYGACGLPYHVMGKIERLDDLVAVTPEEFIEERDIDLRMHHEVTCVDVASSRVTVKHGDETFHQEYDELLLATGARALEPPIDGLDLEAVFTLHSMEDGRRLRSFVQEREPSVAALIGGGYIGMEMAEALDAHGIRIHLFEMLPHVLGPFGEEVAERVEEHLREQGLELHLGQAVEKLKGPSGTVETVVSGDREYSVDLVLVGAGITPNVALAESAGIELGPTGAIRTDEYGRTSQPNIYAAGDCSEETNAVTGQPDWVPLALTANRAGRAIGRTVAGRPTPVGSIVGTALVKVFELEVARTGLIDPERAKDAGFESVSATVTAPSRAHYYPGGSPLRIQMMADQSSRRLLGASMVGREGASKRIDVVATALHAGMTLEEVESLDLSYAPPFSPVWDPVLTAAKVLRGRLEDASPGEADPDDEPA